MSIARVNCVQVCSGLVFLTCELFLSDLDNIGGCRSWIWCWVNCGCQILRVLGGLYWVTVDCDPELLVQLLLCGFLSKVLKVLLLLGPQSQSLQLSCSHFLQCNLCPPWVGVEGPWTCGYLISLPFTDRMGTLGASPLPGRLAMNTDSQTTIYKRQCSMGASCPHAPSGHVPQVGMS